MPTEPESAMAIADVFGLYGSRQALLAAFADVARAATGRPGCLRYTFAEDVDDPDHFILVSQWRDRAALDAHYASEAFADYQSSLHELLARPSEMTIYAIAGSTRLVPSSVMDPRDAD